MIQIIRVSSRFEQDDSRALSLKQELRDAVRNVRTNKVYYLEGASLKHAQLLADKLFSEELTQVVSINEPIIKGATQKIEISYKPGVMNPEVGSILKSATDLGIPLVAADSSTEYHFFSNTKSGEIEKKINKLRIYNKTIEYIVSEKKSSLLVKGSIGKTLTVPIRNLSSEELMFLSQDKLFLNLEEMKVIQEYFKKIQRDPTDCELETLAQTWSEHCAHKTFKAKLLVDGKRKDPLIKRLQKEALKHNKNTVSAFVDNSGVMEFYDGFSICGKAETHNSPSAIEPYGGAATGSGGVFRDIVGTGLGAKPIASTDIFCFADPTLSPKDLPVGCLPPEYILKRVVTGVKDYGNRMGIPTNNGSVHFHKDFRAKPTVIVGAYGILPTKLAKKAKAKIGDVVISVGGRTGRDGIHGATFSSAEMTHKTLDINSSAVQIGNAIEEKRAFDAILEARDENLIRAITDCGAGGFSSAIGEMGEELGVQIDLSKAPLKYQGLAPWEIWVSESQERMIVAIPKDKVKKFLQITKKYNVEASVLGMFDGRKRLKILYGKKIICDLDMKFLHHGLPQRTMRATKPSVKKMTEKKTSSIRNNKEWREILVGVLSHGNVCSKEPIVRLYDHTVQGTNILQPFSGVTLDGPSDASVMRLLLNKPYGMVLSHGINPILNLYDPYWGSTWAAVEALSNYVAVGGDYKNASLINNYSWPFPDEESLWALDQSVDAVVNTMKVFKIPVISGKDSLSSTYRSSDGTVIKIPPVLCMSVFGKIPDVSKTVSSDFKKTGSSVYLVGRLDKDALGGSIYHDIKGISSLKIPHPDLKKLPGIFSTIYKGIQKEAILSCHDVSEGGVITGLFEMCVGGGIGIKVHVSKQEQVDNFLFNETSGCFLVELENDLVAKKLFAKVPFIKLGETQEDPSILVAQNKNIVFEQKIKDLKSAWQKPMQKIFA